MTSTTETTFRAVVLHGENGEFGRSMNAARVTLAEAQADAERLAALSMPDDYHVARTVKVEQTVVTTTHSFVEEATV